MKKLLIVLMLFSTSPLLAATNFDCSDLIGSWQGDRFDYVAGAQRTAKTTFIDAATVLTQFEYDDGSSKQYTASYGRWNCDSNVLTVTVTTPEGVLVDQYEIIELNSSYFVYKAMEPDCEGRYGDCGEITYEVIRIPSIEFDDCGC